MVIACALSIIRRVHVWRTRAEFVAERKSKVVFITGCDSGLGWAMAHRAVEDGLTVVAGFLRGEAGDSAKLLASSVEDRKALHCLTLDITDEANIENAVKYIDELLNANSDYTLHALVNNAGVMTFGEFEWLTPRLIDHHVRVNLLGTLRITHSLLPRLRADAMRHVDSSPRIVTVTSHCAIQPLPTLSVYCATKAALASWTEALRLEISKYGIQVVNFIPGSFVALSNISANQQTQSNEMVKAMTKEQQEFYEEYFGLIMKHLSQLPTNAQPDAMKDQQIMDKFSQTICLNRPKRLYKQEPWIYSFYHALFRLPLPACLKDWLVTKFMKFPSVIFKKQ